MKQCLQTYYKILSLVLPLFINWNLELHHLFVHFWTLYSEEFVYYRELIGWIKRLMKKAKI